MPIEIWKSITSFGVQNLSEELKISRRAIYAWREKGRIPAKQFRNLSNLLDINSDTLAEAIWPHE